MNPSAAGWLNKVPEVTLAFWVIKILSTTVGETVADFLAVDAGLGAGVTTLGMATLLALALAGQFRTRTCTPWIYWLCVVLVSIVGTQITDVLTDVLDVSLLHQYGRFFAASGHQPFGLVSSRTQPFHP